MFNKLIINCTKRKKRGRWAERNGRRDDVCTKRNVKMNVR